MKKRRIIIPLVIVIAAVAGTLAYLGIRDRQQTADHLTLYGNVDIRDVRVAFNVSERIRNILVDEGARVTAGQLLAELDDRRLREVVNSRRADLEMRRQALLELERGSRPEDIEEARGEVAALEAQLVDARRAYERQADLWESRAVSEQSMDNARAQRGITEGKLAAARAKLDRLIAGPRSEDIAAARAEVAAARAGLARAQTDLDDAKLYAPADGVIQNRILEPGDMATPQTPVFSLALTNPIWVRAYLPEPDLGKIREGMPAQITTDSSPGKTFKGWVGFISPTAEFTPRNVETTDLRTRLVYRIRVFTCDPTGELRLGMPVTVTVSLAASPEDGRSDCGQR